MSLFNTRSYTDQLWSQVLWELYNGMGGTQVSNSTACIEGILGLISPFPPHSLFLSLPPSLFLPPSPSFSLPLSPSLPPSLSPRHECPICRAKISTGDIIEDKHYDELIGTYTSHNTIHIYTCTTIVYMEICSFFNSFDFLLFLFTYTQLRL